MRILLADDEQIVLDGLTKILEQYDPTLNIKTAKTGREAIQVAEVFHPDVVFMDIKMPGISGLEALEEIHRQFPQTISVILSAYEQFEFARSAIHLQVLEYMVKPIFKDRFLEVLKRAQNLLDERQTERSNILELREKYQKLIPFFEHDLIFRIIAGMDTDESLALYRDLLNLPKGLCTFMVLQIQPGAETPGDDPWGSEYQIHQHLLRLSEAVRLNFSALSGPVSTSPLTILTPLKGSDEYQARLESVSIADIILRMVPAELKASIGIGKACEFPAGLSRSYQEALMALAHEQLGPIRHFMDLFGVEETDWEFQFNEVETQILEAVDRGLTEQIRELLPQKLLTLTHLFPAEFSRIFQRCRELEILALRQAR
ncbi:MAG TPA: response regulator, partial [Bacillota bacterium]|nr:response regulator [Bacillota bacterium]